MIAQPVLGVPSTSSIILGPDDNTFPHVYCERCGYVWLVPVSGKTYAEAVQNLTGKLSDPQSVKPEKRKLKEETPKGK
jgi:hypothetical protein